jgi:hypothetical protein
MGNPCLRCQNKRRRVEPRRRNYSALVVRKPHAAEEDFTFTRQWIPDAVAQSKLTSLSCSLMTWSCGAAAHNGIETHHFLFSGLKKRKCEEHDLQPRRSYSRTCRAVNLWAQKRRSSRSEPAGTIE